MATVSILPNGETVFLADDGTPLAGGTVDFYVPSTDTRKDTWQDINQVILNANPVVLDSAGRALIWGSGTYRQVLKDSDGNLIWDVVTAELGANIDALQAEIDLLETEITNLSNEITNATNLINTQLFNTAGSHTYTATLGTNAVRALIQAGGGGSAGVTGPGSAKVSIGGGGGGGEFLETPLITAAFNNTMLVVGAPGAPGATGPNGGGAGGNSYAFGATAIGGPGGTGTQGATPPVAAPLVSGGTGGTGPTGTSERPGGPSGQQVTESVALAISGAGGSSNYSPGAPSATCGTNASAAGIGPTGPGGGAAGAVASGTGPAAPGATGGVGQIIILEYGFSPGGTTGIAGGAATQADEEAGLLSTVYTNPAVQQFHDSAFKIEGYIAANGSVLQGYNITNVDNESTGLYTVNFAVSMAGLVYGAFATADMSGSDEVYASIVPGSRTATSVQVKLVRTASDGNHAVNAPFSIMVAGRAAGATGPTGPTGTNEGAVAHLVSQNIAPATPTLLSFPTLIRDDGDFWDSGADTKLTITDTGWYLIGTTMRWSGGGANPIVDLLLNSTTLFPMAVVEPTFLVSPEVNGFFAYYASPGDFFEVRVSQNTSPPITLSVQQGYFTIASLVDTVAVGAFVHNNATQAITNSTDTALAFQVATRDDASLWSSGANTRLTAPTTGWYVVGYATQWVAGGSNTRRSGLRLNGTTSFPGSVDSSITAGVGTRQSCYLQYYMTAGDYFEVVVWQNTGTTRNVDTPAYFYMVELT